VKGPLSRLLTIDAKSFCTLVEQCCTSLYYTKGRFLARVADRWFEVSGSSCDLPGFAVCSCVVEMVPQCEYIGLNLNFSHNQRISGLSLQQNNDGRDSTSNYVRQGRVRRRGQTYRAYTERRALRAGRGLDPNPTSQALWLSGSKLELWAADTGLTPGQVKSLSTSEHRPVLDTASSSRPATLFSPEASSHHSKKAETLLHPREAECNTWVVLWRSKKT
jgi:hypothetical protein